MNTIARKGAIVAAALMALITGARHYGWEMVTPEHAAQVWNIAAASAVLVLSFGWALWARSYVMWVCWLGLAWHELAVLICSAAYIVSPWPIPGGVGQCSAWAHADLSKLGALALLLSCFPLISAISRKE